LSILDEFIDRFLYHIVDLKLGIALHFG
jgi:hypothetical protein